MEIQQVDGDGVLQASSNDGREEYECDLSTSSLKPENCGSFTSSQVIGDDNDSKLLKESYRRRSIAISEAKRNIDSETANVGERASSLQEEIRKKEHEFSNIADNFRKFRREVMVNTASNSSKPLDAGFMDRLEAQEDEKEGKIERLRLKQIGLKKSVKELEQCLKEKEKLADGLDFADLDHVQNEHATLSSKLAERIAEIGKVSKNKKATTRSMVQLNKRIAELTRVNETLETKQAALDEELTKKSKQLYSLRQKHTQLCAQTDPIKQEAKFTNNKMLLQDYAQTGVKLNDMTQELVRLKEQYRAIMQQEVNK